MTKHTQIFWTPQRCRNSAPCSMCNYICKFSEPTINDAEILRLVQWLNILKSFERNNEAKILHLAQCLTIYAILVNLTKSQKLSNYSVLGVTNKFVVFKEHLSLGICTRQNSEFFTLPYHWKYSACKKEVKSVDYNIYVASGKKRMNKNSCIYLYGVQN